MRDYSKMTDIAFSGQNPAHSLTKKADFFVNEYKNFAWQDSRRKMVSLLYITVRY